MLPNYIGYKLVLTYKLELLNDKSPRQQYQWVCDKFDVPRFLNTYPYVTLELDHDWIQKYDWANEYRP